MKNIEKAENLCPCCGTTTLVNMPNLHEQGLCFVQWVAFEHNIKDIGIWQVVSEQADGLHLRYAASFHGVKEDGSFVILEFLMYYLGNKPRSLVVRYSDTGKVADCVPSIYALMTNADPVVDELLAQTRSLPFFKAADPTRH